MTLRELIHTHFYPAYVEAMGPLLHIKPAQTEQQVQHSIATQMSDPVYRRSFGRIMARNLAYRQ